MIGVPEDWRASDGRLRIGLARGLHPPGEVPRLYRGVCPAPELARWHRWRKPLGESVRGVRLKSGSFSDPVGAVFASCKWGRRAFCIVIFDRRSAGVSTGRRTGDCARRVGRGVRGELGMDSARGGGGVSTGDSARGAPALTTFSDWKRSALSLWNKNGRLAHGRGARRMSGTHRIPWRRPSRIASRGRPGRHSERARRGWSPRSDSRAP